MEEQLKPATGKFNFVLGFFVGLATVSAISFFVLLGIMFSNREPINLAEEAGATAEEATATTDAQPVSLPQSDKPTVDVFVMSHCPYGTQIEKGIIPVMSLLKDKITANIHFVYYAMHGETEVKEQLNQYCIQKEQNAKFLTYLTCFLGEGDGAGCLTKTSIDKTKLANCVKTTDSKFNVTKNLANTATWLSGKYPLFDVEADLNEKYQVGGSPTLIINGQEAQAGRDSASLLGAICSSFTQAPAECAQQLSSDAPSAGFGFNGTGDAGAAQCGG